MDPNVIKFVLGEHSQNGDDGTEVVARVAEIICHKEYNPYV